MRFRNRYHAAELLAERLTRKVDRTNAIVFGLPRGGVPVAAEIARKLRVPLDVLVVRKLGFPGQSELAMGAIASGGVRILNNEVVQGFRVPATVIEHVTAAEEEELRRRERAYRGDRRPPVVKGKTAILVDDGIATGSSMAAAVAALKQLGAAQIIVATPTAAESTAREMRALADEFYAVITPEEFYGVGQWYEDFSQTSDEEVTRLLTETMTHVKSPA